MSPPCPGAVVRMDGATTKTGQRRAATARTCNARSATTFSPRQPCYDTRLGRDSIVKINLRRVLRLTGTALVVVLILGTLATIPWMQLGINSGQNYAVTLQGGAVSFYWRVTDLAPNLTPLTARPDRAWAIRHATWRDAREMWARFGLRPSIARQIGMRWINLPTWIPLILVAAPTAILWRAHMKRPRKGACPSCRYNLTGNVSGVCPECGTSVAE